MVWNVYETYSERGIGEFKVRSLGSCVKYMGIVYLSWNLRIEKNLFRIFGLPTNKEGSFPEDVLCRIRLTHHIKNGVLSLNLYNNKKNVQHGIFVKGTG